MKIIGWIREGDRAACDGVVIEGDQHCISHGRPYAFEGAYLACKKRCVIAEGTVFSRLTNGRHRVLHGMKTSGGCPLLSTLNDRDGVGNDAGAAVPTSFFLNAAGEWAAVQPPKDPEAAFDERVQLATHAAAGMHYFVMTNDGRKFSGRVGADGLLPRIDTYGEDEYMLMWGDEALAKTTAGQANE